MILWTIGVCVTWPCLEATTCEGESATTLPRKVGIYNFVWSIAFALGLFSGGMIMAALGSKSMFLLPAIIHGCANRHGRNLKTSGKAWHELPGARCKLRAAPHEADAQRNKMFFADGVAGEPVRVHCDEHGHPAHIRKWPPIFHLSKIAGRLFFVRSGCSQRNRQFRRALEMDWLALPLRLARGFLCADESQRSRQFCFSRTSGCWVAAQILVGLQSSHLLLIAFLFHGRQRQQRRTTAASTKRPSDSGIFLGPAIGFTALHFISRKSEQQRLRC
jgi:hypothetical protein